MQDAITKTDGETPGRSMPSGGGCAILEHSVRHCGIMLPRGSARSIHPTHPGTRRGNRLYEKGFHMLSDDNQTRVKAYLSELAHYGLIQSGTAYTALTIDEINRLADALRTGKENVDSMKVADLINKRVQTAKTNPTESFVE